MYTRRLCVKSPKVHIRNNQQFSNDQWSMINEAKDLEKAEDYIEEEDNNSERLAITNSNLSSEYEDLEHPNEWKISISL